jgi:hypothetical protein
MCDERAIVALLMRIYLLFGGLMSTAIYMRSPFAIRSDSAIPGSAKLGGFKRRFTRTTMTMSSLYYKFFLLVGQEMFATRIIFDI